MTDYKSIITQVLKSLGKDCRPASDPNATIGSSISDDNISWYPSYLFVCENEFFMFRPFVSQNLVDDSEVKEECEGAQHLVDCLKKSGIRSKVFFITSTNEDVEVLEEQDLSQDFGILHNELDRPMLDFSITNTFHLKCRLIHSALIYLSTCKNLKGPIGGQVREFCTTYLKEEPTETAEYDLIREFIKRVLECDGRFQLDTNPIDLVGEIEKMMLREGQNVRDHYFHAVNTMILGFMIIDKFYGNFYDALMRRYGDDIVVEFIWALASLYHDIGHAARHEEDLMSISYGLDLAENEALIDGIVKETRQRLWTSPDYQFVMDVLDHLFMHITSSVGEKWLYDAFPHPGGNPKFRDSCKDSFVEKGAHGVVGALKLALLIKKPISDMEKDKERQFLYRHLMIACISIMFHDSQTRKSFRENSIEQVRAEDFPLSVLLVYADIMQDDRRDPTGSASRPDIFKGISEETDKVVATLEEGALTDSLRKKFLDEFNEAFSFFEMGTIIYGIPREIRPTRS